MLRGCGGRLRRLCLQRAPALFALLCRASPSELGVLGEGLAARWLRRRGWVVVARRVRTPFCEIDLVVRRGAVRACVEVKTARDARRGAASEVRCGPAPTNEPRWRPGHRLGPADLERQRRAAAWLARPGEGVRVDLIEVWLPKRARSARILHHPALRAPLPWHANPATRSSPGGCGRPLR